MLGEEDRAIAAAQYGGDFRLRFQTPAVISALNERTLCTNILIGHQGRMSGRGYFYNAAAGILTQTYLRWLLPGDLSACDVDSKMLEAGVPFRNGEVWKVAPLLDRNLAQVAETAGISFLAIMPDRADPQMPALTGTKFGQYFAELGMKSPNLMHKWHHGILLLNYPTWFYGNETLCPYGVVKRLRNRLLVNGELTLPDIAEATGKLDTDQINQLSKEFPVFRNSVSLAQFCAFYSRYPKSWSEQGVLLDQEMAAFLQSVKLWPSYLKPGDPVLALRIRYTLSRFSEGPSLAYVLQIRTSRQGWVDHAVFRLAPDPPSAPVAASPITEEEMP